MFITSWFLTSPVGCASFSLFDRFCLYDIFPEVLPQAGFLLFTYVINNFLPSSFPVCTSSLSLLNCRIHVSRLSCNNTPPIVRLFLVCFRAVCDTNNFFPIHIYLFMTVTSLIFDSPVPSLPKHHPLSVAITPSFEISLLHTLVYLSLADVSRYCVGTSQMKIEWFAGSTIS